MKSGGRLGDVTANARFLAVFRIVVGAVAVSKGLMLFQLGVVDPLVVAVWVPLAVLVLVGWRSRWAAALLLVPVGFVVLSAYQNHIYLLWLMLVLVAVSDGGRHYVLPLRRLPFRRDTRQGLFRRDTRPSPPNPLSHAAGEGESEGGKLPPQPSLMRRDTRQAPVTGEGVRSAVGPPAGWPVFLMQAQLSIVYVFAGIGKAHSEYLGGDVLEYYFSRSVLGFPGLVSLVVPLAVLTVALEVAVGVLPWWRRVRPVAFGIALPLHVGMLFASVGWLVVFEIALFALMMFALMPAFVPAPEGGRLVVWDDSCSFCRRWVGAFRRLDAFGALRFVGASTPEAYAGTGVSQMAASEAMQLVEPDGSVRAGFDAVRGILYVLPGGFLVAPYLALPGVRGVGHAAYRRVAARRTCRYEAPEVVAAP